MMWEGTHNQRGHGHLVKLASALGLAPLPFLPPLLSPPSSLVMTLFFIEFVSHLIIWKICHRG